MELNNIFNRRLHLGAWLLTFSFLLFLNCKEPPKNGAFILKGTVTDSVKLLTLFYKDQEVAIPIENGHFFFKDTINGAIIVSLYSDSSLTSDPNYVSFFLEPGEIKIDLIMGKFKEAKITGSNAQREKEKMDKLLKPLTSRFDSYMIRREIILKELDKGSPEATGKWKILEEEWEDTQSEIRKENLVYASENRSSHLSSLYLFSYIKFIPKDSAQTIYENFDSEIKNGHYGQEVIKNLVTREPSMVGDVAPAFSTKDVHGNSIALQDYEGKFLLLQFWASWCEPCRKSNPFLVELYQQLRTKDFEIIGLSVDRDKDKWQQAIKKDEIDLWPHVDAIQTAIDVKYNVLSIPVYILIDPKGKIIYRGGIEGVKEKLDLSVF
ncbi:MULTISPECIES: TlpA disulfide reductase family protein [Arenibacter]|uniref:TlpA disulfide reductase family protein n=1 Tax=Arenibacter TaxID=178469 RepID=UPI001864D8A9|nr:MULTISPECIES: TlpA disulfide reductase family protein [Arenibacter]